MRVHSPGPGPAPSAVERGEGVVALVGQPNVGKSSLFRAITGRRVMVSNYPGTTVEVTSSPAKFDHHVTVVDTPGLMSLPSRSPGEEVTIRSLMDDDVRTVVHVGDAKNLRRTILMATQFAELGLPLVVALNMLDEAEARGVDVNYRLLAAHLAVPVIPTVAVSGRGLAALVDAIEAARPSPFRVTYEDAIEDALADMAADFGAAPLVPRAMALLWLIGEPAVTEWVASHIAEDRRHALEQRRHALQLGFTDPLSSVLQAQRIEFVERAMASVSGGASAPGPAWRHRLGELTAHPVWGIPVLGAVLYALYWFVGVFGAGVLVDAVETEIFTEGINPAITDWVTDVVPVGWIADLLVGEYGLWTMGMTYALALILPIVTIFFIAFGLLEDSGYLPRLSVLTNRVFRSLGLNGQAVVPMVLGLGCVTMATLTTRILETKRERMLVILLLALAVPCSAQLGVVMGLLGGTSFVAVVIWGGSVLTVLVAVGWLAARLLPGERTSLLMELPPLRRPRAANVLVKTLARLEWYLKEVVPIFLAGTAVLFLLDRFDVLPHLVDLAEPIVVSWLGLPAATATAFLMGFLRRDFGAAGLFALAAAGTLTTAQLVVAMVTITLFIPCIASVFMIARERGWGTAASMTAVVFPLAFVAGGVLSKVLSWVGWGG